MKTFTLTFLSLMLATGVWAQCNNLFISEYLEGSSNNKAVEIYNPTANSVNLSNYRLILRGFNSSGNLFAPDTMQLSGTLASGAVFVVAHSSANSTILGLANITADSVVTFNGDDAIALFDVSLGQVIDAVGDYTATIDPGDFWTVGTGNTRDHTLVRKSTVQAGTTNWSVGATQWDVYPNNTTTYLGSHSSNCFTVTDTLAVFSPATLTVHDTASAATANIRLQSLSSVPNAFTVDVVLKSGDATLVNNFSSQTVTIGTSAIGSLPLTLTGPTPATLVFALRNPSGNLLIGADSLFTLNIIATPTAPVIPYYPIELIRGGNRNGEPDSIDVVCRTRGTVLGINYRNATQGGFSFTIFNGVDGIGVFSNSSTFGYTVNEGDSIEVIGEVDAFNGYGQMSFLTGLNVLGTGNVPTPRVVNTLDESTESELVRLNNLSVVSTINSGATQTTYEVTNGQNNFELVIYNVINYSGNLPASFHAIGIGRQFDFNSPYESNYQIAPRSPQDIIPASSVAELTSGVMAIFPNPANNVVSIELDANAPAETVKVIDFTGRVVLEQSTNATSIKMDISSLQSGMYLVQIATTKGTSTHKIVKQ